MPAKTHAPGRGPPQPAVPCHTDYVRTTSGGSCHLSGTVMQAEPVPDLTHGLPDETCCLTRSRLEANLMSRCGSKSWDFGDRGAGSGHRHGQSAVHNP